MAIVTVNFVSKSLFRTVQFRAILPVDKIFTSASEQPHKFKTLYLLNGLLGSDIDWISGTRVQRWAEEKNLAVIMPAGENGFYVDNSQTGNMYGQYIGKELIEVTRRIFPLSDRKEDTFIGGLSMGGYGAVRNGLKYHETFGRIISMSGALHLMEEGHFVTVGNELGAFDNDLEAARKTDKNPRVLIEQMKKEGIPMPDIFLACGTEDSLLSVNRIYRDLLAKAGANVTYIEEAGAHEWDFWDRMIKKAIDWLPLDRAEQGLNSGNVRQDSSR